MLTVIYSPEWYVHFGWCFWVGVVLAFWLAFGMGANDTANSFGPVIGAGVLRHWQAYIFATIGNIAGAALLGYKVTETVRAGIVNLDIYRVFVVENGTDYVLVPNCTENCTTYSSAELFYGQVGALGGPAFWLLLASVFKMPVSATQSVVGATVGFSLVLKGLDGIKWMEIVKIVISWVTSPLLAGFFAVVFYFIIRCSVFSRANQTKAALRVVPLFFCFTLAINLFTVFFHGSKYLHFDQIAWWMSVLISLGVGSIVGLFVALIGNKWLHKRAKALHEKQLNNDRNSTTFGKDNVVTIHYGRLNSVESGKTAPVELCPENITVQKQSSVPPVEHEPSGCLSKLRDTEHDNPVTNNIFDYLQVMSAFFQSFSHGSNDTANAVAPLVSLYLAWRYGLATSDKASNAAIEVIIACGSAASMVGLWVMGHKVIKTVGKELTQVNAPSGFAMSLGTAFTVLFASKVGIPVSTTHCMIGAVVFVGIARSNMEGVEWKLFRNIAFAWLVTSPVAGLVSALITYLLTHFILGTI